MASSSLTEALRETLVIFEDTGTPLTTSEVAERLDLGRRSTYERLERLVDQGRLETKKVGASGRIWWRSTNRSGVGSPTDRSGVAESLVDDALDSLDVGIFVLDGNLDVAWINDATERYFGLDRETVLGRDKRTLVEETIAATVDDPAAFAETVLATYDDNADAEQFECRVTDSEDRNARWLEHRSTPIESGTYAGGRVELYYDVTEQTERERELREAKAQLEAATEAGAVGTWEWHVPEDEFVAGPSFAKTFGIDPDVARTDTPTEGIISAIHEDDRDRVVNKIGAALSECGEFEDEHRVRDDEGNLRWVVARGRVECDEAGDPVAFPGAFTDITERKRAEMDLERQRERLSALNSLHGVVQDITDAAIDQSTREEIEQVVCEALADADSYEFAWIGEVEPQTRSITPRAEAGVDGYLEEIRLSTDPDEPAGQGPGGRAARTGEMQVSQDTLSDPAFEPWRETVKKYGYRSTAAIPIVHDGTTYGLVGVYADRPEAFSGEEGEVLSQLGEIVGHTIAATERKRALLSDDVVQLEFLIRDVLDAIGADASPAGTITIDHVVPMDDDDYLVYGTATSDAVDTVEAIVAAVPSWVDVTFRDEAETVGFEAQLSEPPVLSTIATVGGSLENAVIENDDYHITLQVAPGAPVQRVIEEVQSAYPTAEMLRRQQVTRQDRTVEQVQQVLAEELTDRQRSALEAAFYAGFFEWPRDASGEDIADSLNVAPPTFHQHLRKAEKTILESLLSMSATP